MPPGEGFSCHDFTRPVVNGAAITAGAFGAAESGICRPGAIVAAADGVGRGLQWPRIEAPKEERPMTTAGDPSAIYCVRCKAKTGSADLKPVTMKNGRAAAQATCVVCGARKMRFGAVRPQ